MSTKKCNICDQIKDLSEFSLRTDSNTYRGSCKECYNAQRREYKRNNKEKISEEQKKYHQEHREERSVYRKKFYQDHKEYELFRNKKYAEENKEKLSEYYKQYATKHKKHRSNYYRQYCQDNKDKMHARKNSYSKSRKQKDPAFKLRARLSTSIWVSLALQGGSKYGKSILQYLPYTIIELKEHLEKQFEPWMNWDNYGRYYYETWDDNNQTTWTWQIDHIIPQSNLPYSNMEDDNFKKCWSLSNLRPYSAKQNLLDGAARLRHNKGERDDK